MRTAKHAAQCCLLVLCGLPGSGKTTLAKQLVSTAPAQGDGSLIALHVCFDELGCGQEGEEFSPEAWRRGRRAALAAVEAALAGSDALAPAGAENPAAGQQTARRRLVIADDTYHLRSMRSECYALARAHGAAFAQLHLRCTPGLAARRNACRPPGARVPPGIIDRMAAALEPPGAAGAPPWDRHAIAVDVLEEDGAGGMGGGPGTAGIWRSVLAAWGRPAPPPLDAEQIEAVKAAARQATAASLVHGVDIACRRAIAEAMQAAVPKERRAAAARLLNDARLRLLDELRQRVRQQEGEGWGDDELDGEIGTWAARFGAAAAASLKELYK
eukprot:scaffold6.g2838.t1